MIINIEYIAWWSTHMTAALVQHEYEINLTLPEKENQKKRKTN